MVTCLIMGDSIAVGVGTYLSLQGPKCELRAKVGRPAEAIANINVSQNKDVVVISSGSNNPPAYHITKALIQTRNKFPNAKVIWILPYNRLAARTVQAIATRYGDQVVDLQGYSTRDGLHPSNYRALSNNIKEKF